MQNSFRDFFSGGIKGLFKRPTHFNLKAAIGIVLRFIAGYYAVTYDLLKKTGTRKSGNAAEGTAAASWDLMKSEEIQTEHELEDYFSHRYDNLLVQMIPTNEISQQRLELFFYTSFKKLAARDTKVRRIARREETRNAAFSIAFSAFAAHLTKSDFKFTKSARHLFFPIFLNKCKSQLTHENGKQQTFESQSREDRKRHLSEGARARFTDDPPMTDYHVAQLEQKHPDCVKLIRKVEEGYHYKELAKVYKTTEGALRTKATNCRKKLQEIYIRLNSQS